jgi:hypothetical protein
MKPQELLRKLLKVNEIKKVRTVFSEIPNKFLIECINEAEE